MAFFTRVTTNVPFLPSDECHLDRLQSKPTEEEKSQCPLVTTNRNKDNETNTTKNKESPERYDYVIDRVMGVEV